MKWIDWYDGAPISVFINEPSSRSDALHDAPKGLLLTVHEPKQHQSKRDHIKGSQAQCFNGVLKNIVAPNIQVRQMKALQIGHVEVGRDYLTFLTDLLSKPDCHRSTSGSNL